MTPLSGAKLGVYYLQCNSVCVISKFFSNQGHIACCYLLAIMLLFTCNYLEPSYSQLFQGLFPGFYVRHNETMFVQGRSHQIWSDQVGCADARMLYPGGVWGYAPPGKFWNFGAMRLLLRPFLGQCDASRRLEDRVSHECHSAHCVVYQWCWLSNPVCLLAESHTLHRSLWSLRDY